MSDEGFELDRFMDMNRRICGWLVIDVIHSRAGILPLIF
jgi:hypothetical protein